MSIYTVIYDSCVLYPAPLRDLLMQLALTDLFKAKWTDEIHDEWMRNLIKNRPDLSMADLLRVKDLMNKHVEDALVENYQSLIPALNLPDPNDRHILAAAIHCNANAIITFNLRDFPESELSKYNIEAQHPDTFLVNQIYLNSEKVFRAIETILQRLKNPPKTISEYLEILLQQGLQETVQLLKDLFCS
jgi:predicted nucleic acid-binding protein